MRTKPKYREAKREPSDKREEEKKGRKDDHAAKASTETQMDDSLPDNDDIVQNLID